jgi:hypothetical protein
MTATRFGWPRLLVATAIVLLTAFGAWTLLIWTPWDARLGASEAARALEREVGGGPYSCERQEEDITIGLPDVDYFCTSQNARDSAYWIGTDGDKITDWLPAG